MRVTKHLTAVVSAMAVFLIWSPVPVEAGNIVGFRVSSLPGPGTLFSVDPVTGATTPVRTLATNAYIAVSSGPTPTTFFALSPVNLYRFDVFTGETVLYGCLEAGCAGIQDLTYDPTNGGIFAAGSLGPSGPKMLFRLVDLNSPLPGSPNSHTITYQPVGPFNTAITLLEYLPGLGLFGTDGSSGGYLVNETTGQASLLAPLSPLPATLTGLAYDSDSSRLLASSGSFTSFGTGSIYLVDPLTGASTLLNASAPNLIGIAAVGIPEPATIWMLALGLCAARALVRIQRTQTMPLFSST